MIFGSFRKLLTGLYILMITVFSAAAVTAASEQRVYDDAGLFSDSESRELEERIQELKAEQGIDFVVVTTDNTYGSSTRDYADDFYDNGGFGTGSDNAGVLYLIDMDNRQIYLSTCGQEPIRYLNDDTIQWIVGGEALRHVSEGDYYRSALSAIEDTAYYYEENKNSYENGGGSISPSPKGADNGFDLSATELGISGGIGVAAAGGAVGVMKANRGGKVTVTGHDYMKKGAVRINDQRDMFINRTIVRHRIRRDDDGGGHGGGFSSTHHSSGGVTHGGGGHGF